MDTNLPEPFLAALRQHVTASSKNARKAIPVTDWLKSEFHADWRAGHVTARNQVYNRVTEQFKHRSPNVAFVISDTSALQTLEEQVYRFVYPSLHYVLFITWNETTFVLKKWLYQGTAPTSTELAVFPSVQPEPFISGNASVAATPGEQSNAVEWERAIDVSENPSGLVGSLQSFRQAIAALRSGKNVVFTGPPGTGKTELAVAVCETLGISYEMVTATSDWTTFDTVGGYLPDPSQKDAVGAEPLNFTSGCITRSLEQKRWIIIDELNRADIDKAFGELFTVLSDQDVRLPFKRRSGGTIQDVVLGEAQADNDFAISIPDDWRIIGTMNTFDKASLYQLSFAFMRRFAFIDVHIPDSSSYSTLLTSRAQVEISDATLRGETLRRLLAIFCDPASVAAPTLHGLDLLVGPAIPLDILKYTNNRSVPSHSIDPQQIILEAIEMYLLPQFEGQDKKHPKIVRAIATALELDQRQEARIDQALRIWTGHELRKK